jgi:hypothetical protein
MSDAKNHKSNMKKTIPAIIALATLTCCLTFTGCNALDKTFLSSQPVYQPVTNVVTGIITNAAGQPVTVTTTNVVTKTNVVFVPKAGVETAVTVATGFAPFLPPPFNTLAGDVLALISAGLIYYAKRRTDAANTATDAADTAHKTLQAVIAGVEAAGNTLVKTSIQSHAAGAGVETTLAPIVQDVTKNMPGTDAPPATAVK